MNIIEKFAFSDKATSERNEFQLKINQEREREDRERENN